MRHETLTASQLHQAIRTSRIFPVFQPIVSLRNRSVCSFEVLARWIDPKHGEIPPCSFISLGERAGLLDDLLRDQIATACTAAAQWPGAPGLAFNVSPRQFRGQGLVDLIVEAASEASFPLSRLQIEITESAFLDDDVEAPAVIGKLKDLGICIVLDDFGIGHSSLTRLQAIPFDKLKIDASFVRSMEKGRDNSKIVSAVIGLGQSLGMPVVAEGVETEELTVMLEQLGCDYAQGYHLGRPMPASDVPAALALFRHRHDQDSHPIDLSYNLRLAQLRAIYHGVPVGLCFVDRRHRVVSANGRFADAVGLDDDHMLGRDIRSVLSHASPYTDDDFQRVLMGCDFAPRAFLRMGHPLVSLSTIVAARDECGAVIGYTLALIDMSEHRRMIEDWEEQQHHTSCRLEAVGMQDGR